jgi:dihydropteroate synthase
MRKYYTRPCNFYYGNIAKKLIKNKQALPLNGSSRVAFDKVEVFQ